MSRRIVYLNGDFVPESAARISIYDSALSMGDMAYEVTRTFQHQPFRLREHLDRLYHTLAGIETDPGLAPEALEALTLETLRRNLPTERDDVDWQIIHNISRGPNLEFAAAFPPEALRPTVLISCFPLTYRLGRMAAAFQTGIDLVVPAQRALPADLWRAELKTRSRLHYQLANLQAHRRGTAALLVDPRGCITEGTSGNIFLVIDGQLATPARGALLPGITRELVLELARSGGLAPRETDLTVEDAHAASEMFLTSTSIGILHVRSFEGRLKSDGLIGPVTQRLREALAASVGVDIAAQAALYAERLAR